MSRTNECDSKMRYNIVHRPFLQPLLQPQVALQCLNCDRHLYRGDAQIRIFFILRSIISISNLLFDLIIDYLTGSCLVFVMLVQYIHQRQSRVVDTFEGK